MDANIFAVFFLKVIGDVSFRIAIFFAFLCTVNDGQFSTKIIVGYYYGVALIVMVFVFIPYSNREEIMSFRHWIGKVLLIFHFQFCNMITFYAMHVPRNPSQLHSECSII